MKPRFALPSFSGPSTCLAYCVAGIGAVYLLHFALLAFLIGPFDFNHLSTYYELAWRFWMQSPGLPHFNPFFCGGRTLGADPQVPIFHPLTALVGLLGSGAVLRLEMLAQLALGTYGLWNWLRRWEVESSGRLWGCLLFLAGGFTVARFMVGHVTLGFYFLVPLYFLISYRLCDQRENNRAGLVTALGLLFLYCGLYKPNFFLYAAPALAVEAASRSLLSRSVRPIAFFTGALVFAGLACGVSLLPSSDYFREFPRTVDSGPKRIPLHVLVLCLLLPLKAIPNSWYGPQFLQRHEYSVFIGPVALLFAALGMRRLRAKDPERLSLVVFGVFSAWMGLGRGKAFSLLLPYSWFHASWPGFESVRVPVRFWFGAYLCLIVFSAMGFRWPRSRKHVAVVVLLGLVPLLGQATINLSKASWFASQPQWDPPREYRTVFSQDHAQPDTPYGTIRVGKGVIECVENVEALRSPLLHAGSLTDVRSDRPLTLKFEWTRWHRLRVQGHSSGPGFFALNMNHHPYWSVAGERVRIASKTGELLTLETDPGTFEALLTFTQPKVGAGLVISLAALLALGGYVAFYRRKPPRPWRIGLTGGIASGKSQVGEILGERGWHIVDLDAEGRRLTDSDPAVRDEMVRIFGTSILGETGQLDRKRLRALVFSDAEKRARLEALLHPRLMKVFEARVREAARAGARAVVCEAALLVEAGLHRSFDRLIVVTAPLEERKRRMRTRDKMSEEDIDRILAAQSSDDVKTAAADWVVSNTGDIARLREEIARRVPVLDAGPRF